MTDLASRIAALPRFPVFPNWLSHADAYPAESVRQERERLITATANAAIDAALGDTSNTLKGE